MQHQPSRTVIDLTDEADLPSSQPRRSSQRSAAPPQLERTDSISLGQEVITIDSDDDDDEIEFVSEHPLPEAARQRNRAQRGLHQLALPQIRHAQNYNRMPPRPPREEGFFAFGNMDVLRDVDRVRLALRGLIAPGLRQPVAVEAPPRMPGMNLDYGLHPFPGQDERKEEFVPPPPAREGFTRSPKEDDVVVCPACDEELMVDPMETEPGPEKKPSARKKSKADRAEHPFWVVRECGHVCPWPHPKIYFKFSANYLLGLLQ